MKFAAILVVVLLAGNAAASHANMQLWTDARNAEAEKKHPLCSVCVQFASQGINQLLNIILNAGVVGGCGALCSKLPQKTEATICNLLCDIVGIDAFVHLIQKFSGYIDPIFFCEELHTCPINDNGVVKFNGATVNPPKGPQGTTFVIEASFTVVNATGTGEVAVGVKPPQGMPFGNAQLTTGIAPGTYQMRLQLQTQPTEDESFGPGAYPVEFEICDGQCGNTKYPHTKTLASTATEFTITGNSKAVAFEAEEDFPAEEDSEVVDFE